MLGQVTGRVEKVIGTAGRVAGTPREFARWLSLGPLVVLLGVFVMGSAVLAHRCPDAVGYPDLTGENLFVYVALGETEAHHLLERFRERTNVNYYLQRVPLADIVEVLSLGMEPVADFLLGGHVPMHEALAAAGLLLPYVPAEAIDIPSHYRSDEGYWTGLYISPLTIVINLAVWEETLGHRDKPTTWEELLNPLFQGQLILPDPMRSEAGHTFMAFLRQFFGEQAGMAYLEDLDALAGGYGTTGYDVARRTALGEFMVGVSFLEHALYLSKLGLPLEARLPRSTGWTVGAGSIVYGSPNQRAAKRFADFLSSKEALQLHADLTERLPVRNDVKLSRTMAPFADLSLEPLSFAR